MFHGENNWIKFGGEKWTDYKQIKWKMFIIFHKMRVRQESEKAGLKLSIKKAKIMASGPITSGQIRRHTETGKGKDEQGVVAWLPVAL